MSLTQLVRFATPVRDRMAADFPRPRLPLKAELRVPSVAPNRPLMGTAFDYLLRFHLARAMPFATSRQWAAENALALVRKLPDGALVMAGYEFPGDYREASLVCDQMERIIRLAKRLLAAFIAGGPLSNALIRSAINLAHCDTYYRAGRLDEKFGKPYPAQVDELRRLIEVTDWPPLTAHRACLLNPTFGRGSAMVGGADADALLDDLLVDVKTTATLRIKTEDWRQLIAYAALNRHFPIGDAQQPAEIRRLGFYFSRYGYLASWPLEQLVDLEKFIAFAAWLRDYATQQHAERLARRAESERRMFEWREREERRKRRQRARKSKLRKPAHTRAKAPRKATTRPRTTKRKSAAIRRR